MLKSRRCCEQCATLSGEDGKNELKSCARCRAAYYCSSECQALCDVNGAAEKLALMRAWEKKNRTALVSMTHKTLGTELLQSHVMMIALQQAADGSLKVRHKVHGWIGRIGCTVHTLASVGIRRSSSTPKRASIRS